jgi:hypothetical protein
MNKMIVHVGTGTYLNAAECLVVDLEKLPGEALATLLHSDEGELLAEIAEEFGVPALGEM